MWVQRMRCVYAAHGALACKAKWKRSTKAENHEKDLEIFNIRECYRFVGFCAGPHVRYNQGGHGSEVGTCVKRIMVCFLVLQTWAK